MNAETHGSIKPYTLHYLWLPLEVSSEVFLFSIFMEADKRNQWILILRIRDPTFVHLLVAERKQLVLRTTN